MEFDAKIPDGPLADKWQRYQFDMKLVNPANKRKHKVIVVGSGLAGASAAATMAELGYRVQCLCFQDSSPVIARVPSVLSPHCFASFSIAGSFRPGHSCRFS